MSPHPNSFVTSLIPYVLDEAGFKEPVIFVKPKRGAELTGRCFNCGRLVLHGRGELSDARSWLGDRSIAPHGYGRRSPHCCDYGYRVLLPCGSVVDGWTTREDILHERDLSYEAARRLLASKT